MAKKPPKRSYAERQVLYRQQREAEAKRLEDQRVMRRNRINNLVEHRANFKEQLKFYDEFTRLQAEGKLPSLEEVRDDAAKRKALDMFIRGRGILTEMTTAPEMVNPDSTDPFDTVNS